MSCITWKQTITPEHSYNFEGRPPFGLWEDGECEGEGEEDIERLRGAGTGNGNGGLDMFLSLTGGEAAGRCPGELDL